MGYSTWFDGSFSFNKPIVDGLKWYINEFSRIRHMNRDNEKIKQNFKDWEENCFLKDLGQNGEYFIGSKGYFGQDADNSILNYNKPPQTQPGLWCQWIINDEDKLVWDGGEKFYNYIEWLQYLIDNFFKPFDYVLNGEMKWQGDDSDDVGKIIIKNNEVIVKYMCFLES